MVMTVDITVNFGGPSCVVARDRVARSCARELMRIDLSATNVSDDEANVEGVRTSAQVALRILSSRKCAEWRRM
jgi:hypothetical protein